MHAVLHLIKVSGTRVIIHIQRDLIHTGQGMQHLSGVKPKEVGFHLYCR